MLLRWLIMINDSWLTLVPEGVVPMSKPVRSTVRAFRFLANGHGDLALELHHRQVRTDSNSICAWTCIPTDIHHGLKA